MWRRAIIFGLAAVLWAGQAAATESRRLSFEFQFYAGGAQFFTMTTAGQWGEGVFTGASVHKTSGMLDFFVRLNGNEAVEGRLVDGRTVPARFTGASESRFGDRKVDITWNAAGEAQTVAEPPAEQDGRDPVTPAQTVGALDPLSAALSRVIGSASDPCAGRVPIWDGRRRYDLVLTRDGQDDFTPTDYSSFAGTAVRCTVRQERIGGFVPQSDNPPPAKPAMLWLAVFADAGVVVPVRLVVETPLGTLYGHLVYAEVDGAVKTPRMVR